MKRVKRGGQQYGMSLQTQQETRIRELEARLNEEERERKELARKDAKREEEMLTMKRELLKFGELLKNSQMLDSLSSLQ